MVISGFQTQRGFERNSSRRREVGNGRKGQGGREFQASILTFKLVQALPLVKSCKTEVSSDELGNCGRKSVAHILERDPNVANMS